MKIQNLIKTSCGLEKYEKLAKKEGIIAKLRLAWFIVFATMKDWNIKSKDYVEKSES